MAAENSRQHQGDDDKMANMLQARSLRALARVRHAFFTREGGVSGGVYASLNGGPGSDDVPAKVAENRARMAGVLGVAPDRLLTAYQIHSPDVVIIERPWQPHERPRSQLSPASPKSGGYDAQSGHGGGDSALIDAGNKVARNIRSH